MINRQTENQEAASDSFDLDGDVHGEQMRNREACRGDPTDSTQAKRALKELCCCFEENAAAVIWKASYGKLNPSEMAEVTQETMVVLARLAKNGKLLQKARNLIAFACGIARNKAKEALRKKRRSKECELRPEMEPLWEDRTPSGP